MTYFYVMGSIILAALGVTITFFRKGGIYNRSDDTIEPMPSFDTTHIVTPPEAPKQPQDAVLPPETPSTTPLLFDTPKQAFHSTRVICDEMGLSVEQKNEICFTIYGESEFHINAVGKPNKNGTRDWGICQFNDGTIKGVPIWIGEGATFKNKDEVLNNPEKCVRVMIQTYKAGHISWWMAHKSYSQSAVAVSPMWKLKV